ncbi:MAG: DNA primase [Pirellulaceae bacterium]
MSFGATQDAKEQIRQSTDIVELVGGSIPLRRQGSIYVGLCPWHDDSRPSLQVNPDRQSWKCWVCNVGGDVFSWCMQREGIEFPEALRMLADRTGIQLPSMGRATPARPGEPSDKQTLYNATAWAERQFRDCLMRAPEAEAARRYLDERGIKPDSRATFHLGFAPPGWQWLLDRAKSTSYSPAVLEAAGLANKKAETGRYFDFFRGRLIFPIRDTQHRPIGFGGRILPGQTDPGKYINSRDTLLFTKSDFTKSDHVYGLDLARDTIVQQRNVVVVEGYTDVIMAHQHGLKSVIAVSGTALGPRHIRLLRRYADSITLVLDGDEAGQKRTNEVLELFVASDTELRILTLPQGSDPCDFLQQHGVDAMRRLLDTAPDAFGHAIQVQTRGVDLVQDTHRANQALEALLAILAKSPRVSSGGNSAKRLRERQILARLAREFRVEEPMLRMRIGEMRRAAPAPRVIAEPALPATGLSAADLEPHDAELLEILVAQPSLADVALEEISTEQLVSDPARAIFERYRQLGEMGNELDFGSVLSATDEPRLKSLLVDLDERSRSKEENALDDAAVRLNRLIEDIRYRHGASKRRDEMSALEDSELDETEKQRLFLKLLEEQRKRQGIPAPTDG